MRTAKDIKDTIKLWISKNPDLSLYTFHTVGGNKYAIQKKDGTLITDCYTIRELEGFLLGVFNSAIYLKKLEL